MKMLGGYAVIVGTSFGETPEEACNTLSELVIEANQKYGLVPQGGADVKLYLNEDNLKLWVVTQAVVAWEEGTEGVQTYIEEPRG
jgi:hypothetical protein